MEPAVMAGYIVMGVLYLVAFGVMGYLAISTHLRKRYKDSRGCRLWEIDTGESVWVAAFWRWQALDWYSKNGDLDPYFSRDELDICCSREPCLLKTKHYRDLGCTSEGKESFRETMEKHHRDGGTVPFMVSTTCG